ncbi:MAG: hypothetical protein LM632_09460 [Armatimonadetes bacterium]|nr:hypothetical protein [Armatimonadota bacterium]
MRGAIIKRRKSSEVRGCCPIKLLAICYSPLAVRYSPFATIDTAALKR